MIKAMREYRRISDEQLREAVVGSRSITDLLRGMGYKSLTGGTHSHISRKVKRLGIDTSYFLGSTAALVLFRDPHKLPPEKILVVRGSGRRQAAFRLRRAMIESGVPYCCKKCGLGPLWGGQELRLEVDHENNNCLDDRIENVRFLCPNCHSQIRHAMNLGYTTVTQGSWRKEKVL